MDVVATSGKQRARDVGERTRCFQQGRFSNSWARSMALAAADINGDGAIDVVTSNSESNSLNVLLGKSSRYSLLLNFW
jgi:hypothetical protein